MILQRSSQNLCVLGLVVAGNDNSQGTNCLGMLWLQITQGYRHRF